MPINEKSVIEMFHLIQEVISLTDESTFPVPHRIPSTSLEQTTIAVSVRYRLFCQDYEQ